MRQKKDPQKLNESFQAISSDGEEEVNDESNSNSDSNGKK